MDKPSFYITGDTYCSMIGSGSWAIQDLSPNRAEEVRSFLNSPDTFAVFASGVPPQSMPSPGQVIAGIDWVRSESRRKDKEPPFNVYHFEIRAPDENGYPVYACKEGKSIAPHWSEWTELDVYMPGDRQKAEPGAERT